MNLFEVKRITTSCVIGYRFSGQPCNPMTGYPSKKNVEYFKSTNKNNFAS